MRTFAQLSACERAVCVLRLQKLYQLRYPETAKGQTGRGRARSVESALPFRVWCAQVHGIPERTLYNYAGLGKVFGESALRKLHKTNANDLRTLKFYQKLPLSTRDHRIANDVLPLESPREFDDESIEYIVFLKEAADLMGVPA